MRPSIGDRVQKLNYGDTGTVIHLQQPGGEWLPQVAYVNWDSTGASWEPVGSLYMEGAVPHVVLVGQWDGWEGVQAYAKQFGISNEAALRELADTALSVNMNNKMAVA